MKSNVLILIVVLSFCGVMRINAQFEDVKECLQNDQFISYVVDCFGAKIYALIDEISRPWKLAYSPETPYGGGSHVGRKLQSIDGSQMQSYYLKRLSTQKSREQAEATQSSMQSIAESARRMLVELTKETSQVENGPEKYLDEVLDVLLRGGRTNPEVLGLLRPVLVELEELRAGLDRMEGALNSEAEELANVPVDAFKEVQRIKKCLDELNEEEFEDGFTWLRCLYTCSDLPLTSSCFIDNFNLIPACGRIPWMADLMMRLFVDYMKLQTCYIEVLSPNRSSTPLNLTEGRGVDGAGGIASSQVIEFRSYLPPGVHCFPADAIANRRALIGDIVGLVFNTTAPCVVQIQMTTSNYIYDLLPYVRLERDRVSLSLGRPKCRNRTAINQISIGWHDNAVNASGIIVLERDNWNATFRVPVAARIDHKVEDDEFTEVNFTMKMVVDGAILNSTKVLTRVYNRDVDSSICQSINDPHIVTFDNRYYNNFYQGYFTMYKNTALPYEVQIIYQSCGPSAPSGESCNCGVAVKSGDDVFVVDRCRLKPEHCIGEDCRLLKVTLYVNGALTPGTRIFQEDGGLSYQIILPHGTIIKVKSNGEELINVWIIPSPYDRENTVGLCGTFNVNPDDDFTLPDGSLANITHSEDTQPGEFIEAWRVPPEDRIFIGVVSDESFHPGNYCRCSHYVLSGIECHCGYGELVETCDLSLGNEFTPENLTSLVRHSIRGSDPYLNQSTYEDKRDINETLIPDDPDFQGTEATDAKDYCTSFLNCSTENLLKSCRRSNEDLPCESIQIEFHESIINAYKGCMDDYKITHNNATVEWKMAATDAAKVGCLTWFQRSPKVNQDTINGFQNETCINECYGRGTCEYGRCVCEDGFGGADCSLFLSSSSSSSRTPVLLTEDPLLCDRRHEDCSYATIYGRNFTDDDSIVCTSTQIKVLDTESVSSSAKSSDVKVLFINLNQVSCRLPYAASYRITVKHNDKVLSPPSTGKQYSSEITFMAYDSVCYTCDTSAEKCTQKQDRSYCMVSGVCYENLQPYATDNCRYCNVSYSKDHLYDSQDPYCVQRRNEEAEKKAADKKNQDIRIAVGCSLSGIIIIISIIAFILTKRKEKKMKSAEKSEIGSSIGDKITYTNPEFSPTEPVSEHNITSSSDKGGKAPPSSSSSSANNNTLSPFENVVVEVSPYYEETSPPTTSTTTSTPSPPPVTRSPPDTIVVKHRDLERVRGAMDAEGRNRTTSTSSGISNTPGGEPPARRASDAASIKSLGIGGGGPIVYGRVIAGSPRSRDNSTGDQMGIGAHGMPSSAMAAAQSHSTFVSEKL